MNKLQSNVKLLQKFFVAIPDVYVFSNRQFILKSDRFFIYNLSNWPCLPIRDLRVFLLYKTHFFDMEARKGLVSAKKIGVQ